MNPELTSPDPEPILNDRSFIQGDGDLPLLRHI